MTPPPAGRLIVALDAGSLAQAEAFVSTLRPAVRWFKVGSELFTACGPDAVRLVLRHGGAVFLDLKWHDIPSTVAGAVRSAIGLGTAMMNVHISAGETALCAAAAATESVVVSGGRRPILIGVTTLTSTAAPIESVVAAARLARDCGLDGVVASALEAAAIKAACGRDFLVVTPGIRLQAVPGDDQTRVVSPADAVRAGADYLVVGRPITQAADPLAATRAILAAIGRAGRAEGDSAAEDRTKAAASLESFD